MPGFKEVVSRVIRWLHETPQSRRPRDFEQFRQSQISVYDASRQVCQHADELGAMIKRMQQTSNRRRKRKVA